MSRAVKLSKKNFDFRNCQSVNESSPVPNLSLIGWCLEMCPDDYSAQALDFNWAWQFCSYIFWEDVEDADSDW